MNRAWLLLSVCIAGAALIHCYRVELKSETGKEGEQKVKYAIFDLDGTLSKGYISMGFLDYLYKKGLYDPKEYDHQMKILKDYKEKRMSYDDWVNDWALTWARGIKGQKESDIKNAAKDFFKTFKAHIYPQAQDISSLLKRNGYELFVISAGVYEVVDLARRYLGMHKTIATRCEVEDGKYTGKLITNVHTKTGKGEHIDKMIRDKNNVRPAYVFGDSPGDISMLNKAETPVALNPHPELEEEAKKQGWRYLDIKEANDFLENQVEAGAR